MSQTVLLLLGVLYAIFYWIVCARRPQLALMLVVAVSPFQNDLSGGGPVKFSLAEINLLLSVPLAILGGQPLRMGPTLIPAISYIGTGLFSSLIQWRSTTVSSLVQIGIYLVVVVAVFASLARNVEDYRSALNGFVGVCVFLAICVCIEGKAYIFGMHKNGMGASLATALVVAFALWTSESRHQVRWRYLLAMAILAAGTLVSLSRGAWLAAGTGILLIMGMRREFALLVRTSLVLGTVITIGWLKLPETSRDYATDIGSDRTNIMLRYQSADYAMECFRSNPAFGLGVGLRKEYDATNVILLALAETGIPGLLAFVAVQITVLALVWRTYQRLPANALSFAVVALAGALTTGKLMHGMVDHYWSRGSLTVTWAAVGMAVHVSQMERRRKLLKAVAAHLALAGDESSGVSLDRTNLIADRFS